MHHRRLLPAAAVLVLAISLLLVESERSASAQAPSLTFTAAGDFAANTNTGGVLTAIRDSGSALTLALGDMSYGVTGQEQAWCDFVTTRVGVGYPFELVSGNHESNGQNGNVNDFSACLPNQLPGLAGTYGRQWYVDVPAAAPVARFVMISPNIPYTDSVWSYAAGTARYNWTAAAIDGARARNIPWVVVGMHKPCLSLGEYTCEPGVDITNLMLQKKVDLVLSGHEHLYQRTKQIALAGGCPSLPAGTFQTACVVDADNALAKDFGTVFATVGTGGVALRNVNAADTETGYFAASSGLNSNPTYGALKVGLTADVLSAQFVRGSGGTFTDAFTITRGAAPPTNAPPTAAFAAPSCTGSTCTYDASASADTDGTVASYAWNFGDNTTGTGVTTSHTYAAPGTYTVTLTVTDDDGATATATRQVTIGGGGGGGGGFTETFPGANGSPWPAVWITSATNGSVTQNAGTGVLAYNDVAGAFSRAQLSTPATADTDLLMSYRWNSTAPRMYWNVWVRGSAWADSYRPRDGYGIQLSSSSPGADFRKSVNGTQTTLATVANAQTVTTAKQWLRLRAVGSTIQFRTWLDGQTEPTTWASTITDTSVTTAGTLHVSANRSSSNSGAKSVALDDISFGPPR